MERSAAFTAVPGWGMVAVGASALFTSRGKSLLADDHSAEASAEMVPSMSVSASIAMMPSVTKSPTNFMECLAAKWRFADPAPI